MPIAANGPPSDSPERASGAFRIPWFIDGLLLFGVGAALVAATWRTWPDVLVDFGRELYVPWQLAQGKVLYRDIAYFNGPLSPYLNSVWMRLFGASLMTLVWCNLALLALICGLLYWLLRRCSGRLGAFLGVLMLLTTFAFPFRSLGNNNYVCPYSHELTHGLLLALLCLAALVRFGETGQSRWAYLSALALGFTALTKPEMLAATGAAALVGLSLIPRLGVVAGRGILRVLPGALLAALAPVVSALAWFSQMMSPRTAFQTMFAAARWACDPQLANSPFYQRVRGTLPLMFNLEALVAWGGGAAAILGAALLADLCIKRKAARLIAAAAFAGIATALAAYGWNKWAWQYMLHPAPVFLLGVVFAGFVALRDAPRPAPQLLCAQVLGVFALALLAKIILHVQVYQYGFVLAMPATVLITVALCVWAPAWIRCRTGRAAALQAAALAIVAVIAVRTVTASLGSQARLRFWVGAGDDRFRADGRGQAVELLMQEFARIAGPHDTLAVLPEGVMINFLTRRLNPTPYTNFMPPELLMFGEENMLQAFVAAPPDFIILAHKDTSEYGPPLFGLDYGTRLMAWIDSHYETIRVLGNRPLQDPHKGGISLAKRKT